MNWLITGVSSGLGRALAETLLAQGHHVAGTVRQAEALKAFEALAPGRAMGLMADVTDVASVKAAVAAAETAFGQLDVVVNNAGYGLICAIEEATPEEFRAVFEVNVFGAVNVIQAVLPTMRARRAGCIINITSVSGYRPWAGSGFYGATKYAMEGLGRTLAEEVRELGIRVINVAPGGFRTHFSKGSLTTARTKIADYDGAGHAAERILRDHAGHEGGDPKKAAQAIITIASAPNPPLGLLLGADALGYAEAELADKRAEMDAWKDLILSTAIDEAAS
ncbi:oxidoreductase [Asticcacaulis sp. EMRT-3]|uniref:oxidoreductase n=1 Tax=Asticcacaulis sp. EMRT-3 TaxID=3040349 RepID=UPI0024AF3837|nr:oxidoreductase [Asticcacaulis sp. EMRT-3]MDI7773897.1 oxidoreductase [Asticcacaulis sp. EMRT-3]